VAGASWRQIGSALGVTRQAAWESHSRWIDEQAALHARADHEGFDRSDEAEARSLAGTPDAP
jgi:hypothetical protein